METELALNDEITAIKAVTALLDLYLHLIQLNTLSSILSLDTHDNSDISTSVLSAIIVESGYNSWRQTRFRSYTGSRVTLAVRLCRMQEIRWWLNLWRMIV